MFVKEDYAHVSENCDTFYLVKFIERKTADVSKTMIFLAENVVT